MSTKVDYMIDVVLNILVSLMFWGATNWGIGVAVFAVGWILIDRWYWRNKRLIYAY